MTYGLAVAQANALLNALLRNTAYTPPVAIWAKLHVGDPGAAGTANASSVTTRQQVTFSAAASGAVVEATVPSWGNWAGTSPETIVGLSLWDASTAGSFVQSVLLNNGITVTTGQPLTLPAFTISFAGVAA
ncbi:MAG TPA: hypothetical protein VIV12_05430 [Streptosporangiaceae bacterium]